MTTFVIGYDISDGRRLQQVHRALLRYAAPIEYSIFLLEGDVRAARCCMDALLPLIDPKEDDLRCYPLPMRGMQGRIGVATLPQGIIWTGLPATLA
jgi:CRISPR-associated protein Cas2